MPGKHKTIPIFVPHLGCPQDCLFCDQKKITGQKEEMTAEKARAIIAEGTKCRCEGDYIEIGFFGGSFTGIPAGQQEALLEPAYEAVVSGKADGIRLSTRPDYINDAVLERLKRFGVTTVELGAQSMCDEVLSQSRRGHSAAQTISAAEKIHAAGLNLGLQMMLGLPGDSPEETKKTVEAFIIMKPQCVRIYPTLVIRGTALEQLYLSGGYEPLSLEEAVEQCAEVYLAFRREKIDVIRMGLLDMEPESVCAGPQHPAFGELVMGQACKLRLWEALKPYQGKGAVIRTNPRYVSVLVGQKRKNINQLAEAFNLKIHVEQDDAIPWEAFDVLPEN